MVGRVAGGVRFGEGGGGGCRVRNRITQVSRAPEVMTPKKLMSSERAGEIRARISPGTSRAVAPGAGPDPQGRQEEPVVAGCALGLAGAGAPFPRRGCRDRSTAARKAGSPTRQGWPGEGQ